MKKQVHQRNGPCLLKKLGTAITFNIPPSAGKMSIVVFSNADRSCDNGQLCYIAEILIDEFVKHSVFHLLSWYSHRANRTVRSIGGGAEILAAGEEIDEGKDLAHDLSIITTQQIDLIVALDTNDLFTTLST